MRAEDQLLKEKALMLFARERELLQLRQKLNRLSMWLEVANDLPAIVSSNKIPAAIYSAVVERMLGVLQLQCAYFFEIGSNGTLRVLSTHGASPRTGESAFGVESATLIDRQRAGTCNVPDTPVLQELAAAVGLHRFMWYKLMDLGHSAPMFLVVGYEREKAAFYAPFEQDDLGQLRSMGHHIEALLRNAVLIRELEREKQALADLNATLEERVARRTDELARTNQELEGALHTLREKERHLHDDLEQARAFQQQILPVLPRSSRIDFAAAYRPLELVGGDVYDLTELEDGRFRIFLADMTGHGVQASLRTMLLKSEYDRLKNQAPTPDRVLRQLNTRLMQRAQSGEMLCTACCFDVCPKAHGATVRYANAAHPPLLVVSNGAVDEIYADSGLLGAADADADHALITRELAPSDLLLAYSDGLSDAIDGCGVNFRLDQVLLDASAQALSAQSVVESVLRTFDAFHSAATSADDITVLGARLLR